MRWYRGRRLGAPLSLALASIAALTHPFRQKLSEVARGGRAAAFLRGGGASDTPWPIARGCNQTLAEALASQSGCPDKDKGNPEQ